MPHSFRQWLLGLYACAKISAEDVTTGASLLGPHAAAHNVSDLALDPRTPGGHRQGGRATRVVEASAGVGSVVEQEVHWERVPCHDKRTGARIWRMYPFMLPHTAIHLEGMQDKERLLTNTQDLQSLPRIADNPTVRRWGFDRCCLLRLYCDGVPYQGKARTAPDTVLGIYWSVVKDAPNLQHRRPIVVFRKQDMCRCWCGGRCTIDVLMETVAWSVLQLNSGQFAAARWDGSPLPRKETALAGQPLSCAGAVVEMCVDLAELNHTLGFRAHNATHGCCLKCVRSQRDLHNLVCEVAARSTRSYLDEVQAAVVQRNVSAADARALQRELQYQDGQNGTIKGRVLQTDVAGFLRGDRLELGGSVVDVGQDLSALRRFPAIVRMWRGTLQGMTNFPCPLLTRGILFLEDILADVLHTVDAGAAQYLGGMAFSLLVEAGALGVEPRNLKAAAVALEPRLMSWYDQVAHPRASRLVRLTPRIMCGQQGLDRPCIHAKAFESRFLCRYALWELRQNAASVQALGERHRERLQRILSAGDALEQFYTIVQRCGPRVPVADCRELAACVTRHCAQTRAAGVVLAFKHHWFRHMALDVERSGNPRVYSTYTDETFNCIVARTARALHPRHFGLAALKRLKLLERTRAP